MAWIPPRAYKPGELYVTTTGRTVEILAADEAEDDDGFKMEVIAYKAVGATMVHLRAARQADRWTLIEQV